MLLAPTQKKLGTTQALTPQASLQVLGAASAIDLDSYTLNKTISASSFNENLLSIATTDPNGTIATADDAGSIPSNISKSGRIGENTSYGRDRHDYWKFNVKYSGDVGLSLSGLSADAGLAIYDNSGKLITYSNKGGTTSESIQRNLAAGNYYALIYSYSGNGTAYNLGISSDSNGHRPIATPLGNLTSSLTQNNSIGHTYSYGRDQHDYFKFSVTDAAKVNLSMSNLSADAGLALYNSSGQLLTYSNKGGTASESITRWLGKGDYYALAYSYSGSGTSYKLDIAKTMSLSSYIKDYTVENAVSSSLSDGKISRNEMINILRSTKDAGGVVADEVTDLRNIANSAEMQMDDYVRVLSKKAVFGNVANTKSGIGNLSAGMSDTKMEQLVGKWFYGNDRPTIGSGQTYRYTSGSLFQNGISYTDVDQGAVGDCYYLASLGAAAHQKTSKIQDMFIDNGDGTFTVKFYKNGAADYVTVDRYLPTNGSGYFVYANNSSGKKYNDASNELWVALAEKAYAQVNEEGWIGQDGTNSYAGIAFGWPKNAMNHVTGLSTSQSNISISDIVSKYNANRMVALNTNASGTAAGIVDNHSYVMVGYNATTNRFKLYNPHGGSGSTIELTHQQIQDNFRNWDYTTT